MPANRLRPAALGMAALVLLSVAACGSAAPNPNGSPRTSLPVEWASTAPTVAPSGSAAATPSTPAAALLVPEAVIDIPGSHDVVWIATGHDAMWIAGDGELFRVDPADNSKTSIPVPIADGSWSGIHVDGDQLWASDYYGDALVHVDLPSGKITRTSTTHPTGPAWSSAGIWLAAEGTGTLSRIDPATGAIDLVLDPSGPRRWPSVIDDRVWYGGSVDGVPWAIELDPSTGKEVGRVELPKWTGCYFMPGAGGLVWTIGGCNGAVRNAIAVIDRETSAAWSVESPKAFLGSMVVVGDATWLVLAPIADNPGRLVEYDRTGPTGRVIDLPPDVDPDGLLVAFGSIWIPADAKGKVYRFPIGDLDGG